jgi:outer membrane protein assembly factor BamB
MRRPGAVVRSISAAVLAVSLSGCWLQPGYDAGHGNWNPHETTLSSDTVGKGLVQRWRTTVLGVATSVNAPVASGGRIYVTTGFGASASALDARTGAVLWTRDLFDPAGGFSQSLTAPALVDGELVLGKTSDATHGAVYRLDPDTGAVLGSTPGDPVASVAAAGGVPAVHTRTATVDTVSWKYDAVAAHPSPLDPSPGGFAIVGERILWSNGDFATGYSPACPASPAAASASASSAGGCGPDWSTDLGGPVSEVAAIGHGQVVYTYGPGSLAVLDVATGAVRWRASVTGFPGAHIAAVADGKIVVAAFNAVLSPQLVAFPAGGCGAATCSPLWTAEFATTPGGIQTPFVAAGDLVWAGGTLPGESGAGIHAFPLDGCGAPTCEPIASVPYASNTGTAIVHDGQLVIGDNVGRVITFGLPSS